MFELCASILAANFACLKREVRAAESAGGDVSYIDIMDGHFVSAISFGTGIVRAMGRLTQKPLDVHLMVENPLPFIPELAEEKPGHLYGYYGRIDLRFSLYFFHMFLQSFFVAHIAEFIESGAQNL